MVSFLGFIIASCPHFFFPSVSALFLFMISVFTYEFTSVYKNRIDLGDFLGPSEPNDCWIAIMNNAYMVRKWQMAIWSMIT